VFQTVVHWRKLNDVEKECTLHNSVVLAISVPKIIKGGGNLTKLWWKQLWLFFFIEKRCIRCLCLIFAYYLKCHSGSFLLQIFNASCWCFIVWSCVKKIMCVYGIFLVYWLYHCCCFLFLCVKAATAFSTS